ncbi:MAG TPA: hypothetical protein VHM72_05275 [Solirubrobacteraceae bacterium]|jgi:hypothetical protein|nr:hypothetical protein [Solirubrobacteraceae bacterium]
MRRRSRFGVGWLLGAAAVGSIVAGAGAAAGFPAAVYPPPVKSAGGALAACPNPSGLERFDKRAQDSALRAAGSYGRVSLAVDMRHADRAWWPWLRELWRSDHPAKGATSEVVAGSSRGPKTAYAAVVRYSCGSPLVLRSIAVYLAPRHRHNCDACVASVYFIDRRGHALIYWLN